MPYGPAHPAPGSRPSQGATEPALGPGSAPASSDHPGPDARLNLLLSWGGWRPDSWADRMAALLEPMGVTSLKARTARQAEQVIRSYPVHIAVVDLGLPLDFGSPSDEAGPRVLDLLRRMSAPPPVVVVRSPRNVREMHRDTCAALRCDAFAVVDRRSADVELMLKVLQRCMERFYHGRWPGDSGYPGSPSRAPHRPGTHLQ